MKMRTLAICGGGGVICHPFKKSLIANLEPRAVFKTPDEIQWKLNFGDIPVYRDYKLNRFKKLKPNIIVSHPTCGHSSILALSRAKKFGNGKKDETIQLFIRSIRKLKPNFFLFENLPNLFSSFPESEFDSHFKAYTLKKWCVSVGSFGNSQLGRKRLVIVGIKKGLKTSYSSVFELPSQENLHLKSVKELEALSGSPNADLFHIRESDDLIITMERDFKKLNLKQVRDIWNSKEYGNRKSWDATTTGKGRMKTLPGVYRNRADEFPRTVLKNHRQFNTKGYIMSPRELAIIQGIPNEFKLYYDPKRLGFCLNKARITTTKTPPYEIGQWFYNCLRKIYKPKTKKHGNCKKVSQ